MKKKRGFLSQTQYIAYGFFVLILVGTLLLMLPFASRNGQSVNFLDALFTSTSASCVTGLVVRDTWSQWSLFGQFVIIFLIQIGGLGFVTVGVFFSIVPAGTDPGEHQRIADRRDCEAGPEDHCRNLHI